VQVAHPSRVSTSPRSSAPPAQPAGRLSGPALAGTLAHIAGSCTGRVGVAARRLGSKEAAHRHDAEQFRAASTVKVAVYAAVIAQVRSGKLDLDCHVSLALGDLVGGSGVLGVLRPGSAPTVADLCTLMIVVSDNSATNLLIDLLGGVGTVNRLVRDLGFAEVRLHRRLGYPPPPLVAGRQPPAQSPPGTLATATPASLCRLMSVIAAGTVIDRSTSELMLTTLAHQQDRSGIPRAFVELAEPGDCSGRAPGIASKTGSIPGCRCDIGVMFLPHDTKIAYAVMVDNLADTTMTTLSEGDEVLGRIGAALLRRWWPGPGAVPVRDWWP